MAAQALLIEVGLLDDRWHGVGDWPPSPFRLFQALVAGAYGGRWASEDPTDKDAAFRWLESLDAPTIAAPPRTPARTVKYYVPNNDMDSVERSRTEQIRREQERKIRTGKEVRPVLLEGGSGATFRFLWRFDDGVAEAERLCGYAERLHALGRGVDAAYARARVVSPAAAAEALEAHGGGIARPSGTSVGGGGARCPAVGSLDSLKRRHAATLARFKTVGRGRNRSVLFHQPPKAQYRPVAYDSPPTRLIYALRRAEAPGRYRPVPQREASMLAARVRDQAAKRLADAAPELAPLVESFLIGRGAHAADSARRVRILPLPTISGFNAAVRRIAVEIPADCPLRSRDLAWAFGGLAVTLVDPGTGKVLWDAVLAAADADATTEAYLDTSARRWRSVTPVALPERPGAARSSGERVRNEAKAAGALAAALRHAGVEARPLEMRLQREPLIARGARADAFVAGRFEGRLRHVEVLFDRPVSGPLAIGDGRFVGLGLMRPVEASSVGLHVFAVEPSTAPPAAACEAVLRALRRAVMASVQRTLERGEFLPALFHGHDDAGRPARSGRHEHLFYAAWSSHGEEGRLDRLAVVSPHMADHHAPRPTRKHLDRLARALEPLGVLRAGPNGLLRLTALDAAAAAEPPFAAAATWESATPYRPARHPARGQEPGAAVTADLLAECARRGLPRPQVEALGLHQGPRGGLCARLSLRFAVAVTGPVLLGRGSHFGAGLFAPATA